MKLLPIGIQSFGILHNGGYLYVDKTRESHHLLSTRRIYFLETLQRSMQELFCAHPQLAVAFSGREVACRMDEIENI